MALDVVLAVSLMWVAQDGEMKSSYVRGTYRTMSACVVALNDQIDAVTRLTGATPVASGDLCLPRDLPHEKARATGWMPAVRDPMASVPTAGQPAVGRP